MARDLEWKEVRVDNLNGEDAKIVKAFIDARAKLEDYIQAKQGPCLFSYKRNSIAFAKANGSGRAVSSLS